MNTQLDHGSTQAAGGILHPWQDAASLPEYVPFNCSVVGWCATTNTPLEARLRLGSRVIGSTVAFKSCLHPQAIHAATAMGAGAFQFTIVPHQKIDRDEHFDIQVVVSFSAGEDLVLHVPFKCASRLNYEKALERNQSRERSSMQRLAVFLINSYKSFCLTYFCAASEHSQIQSFINNAAPFVKRTVETSVAGAVETTVTVVLAECSALKINIMLGENSRPDETVELRAIIETVRRIRTAQPLVFKLSECVPEFDSGNYTYLNCGGRIFEAENVRRVLVIKLDRIGDVVSAAAALQRLRETFPRARICLAVTSYTVDVARRLGLADEIAGLEQFLGETWDIAVDLRLDQDTRVFLEKVSAHFKASFGPPLEDHNHLRLPGTMPVAGSTGRNHARHVSDQLVGLADALAASFGHNNFPTRDTEQIERRVVMNIGPSNDTRCWPVTRFAQLAAFLAKENNLGITVLGSEDERPRAERLIEALRQDDVRVQDCIGNSNNSAEIIDIIGKAMLFVGYDSGPKHIARVLNVPGIVVHGGRHVPAVWGGNTPTIFDIYSPVDCSPCLIMKKEDCPNNSICVQNIEVEAVRSFAKLAIDLLCLH